jgi:hypothetical protein
MIFLPFYLGVKKTAFHRYYAGFLKVSLSLHEMNQNIIKKGFIIRKKQETYHIKDTTKEALLHLAFELSETK